MRGAGGVASMVVGGELAVTTAHTNKHVTLPFTCTIHVQIYHNARFSFIANADDYNLH